MYSFIDAETLGTFVVSVSFIAIGTICAIWDIYNTKKKLEKQDYKQMFKEKMKNGYFDVWKDINEHRSNV